MTHQAAAVTMACPEGLPEARVSFVSLMCNIGLPINDCYSKYSPGPVSQVDGNCTTLGWLLSNKCDSPIHQNGLSPKSILGN